VIYLTPSQLLGQSRSKNPPKKPKRRSIDDIPGFE
jgi:hypothetical protein